MSLTVSLTGRIRAFVVPVALAACAVAASPAPADAQPTTSDYIITVQRGEDPRGIARAVEANPRFVYRAAINGFAAELNEGQLRALRNNPKVRAVEQDRSTSLAATTQAMDSAGEPWGLDRIDQHSLPLSGTYSYEKNGSGAHAYVIDTGIQSSHPEFKVVTPWFSYSRASNDFDAFGGSGEDCHSHGTHVAGTVGGKTYGVAKGVWLHGIRVFDCFGNTTLSKIIAGVDWVTANRKEPAVVNMSLRSYPASDALDAAVNTLAGKVFVAVAAGNDNIDACKVSPARVPAVYTVAGTDRYDKRYTSSNYGSCVDAYAPAVAVKSAWTGSGSGLKTGTSMASPHVAGVGALLCSYGAEYCTPSFATSWIDSWTTNGVVINNVPGTPNKLLWKGGL